MRRCDRAGTRAGPLRPHADASWPDRSAGGFARAVCRPRSGWPGPRHPERRRSPRTTPSAVGRIPGSSCELGPPKGLRVCAMSTCPAGASDRSDRCGSARLSATKASMACSASCRSDRAFCNCALSSGVASLAGISSSALIRACASSICLVSASQAMSSSTRRAKAPLSPSFPTARFASSFRSAAVCQDRRTGRWHSPGSSASGRSRQRAGLPCRRLPRCHQRPQDGQTMADLRKRLPQCQHRLVAKKYRPRPHKSTATTAIAITPILTAVGRQLTGPVQSLPRDAARDHRLPGSSMLSRKSSMSASALLRLRWARSRSSNASGVLAS